MSKEQFLPCSRLLLDSDTDKGGSQNFSKFHYILCVNATRLRLILLSLPSSKPRRNAEKLRSLSGNVSRNTRRLWEWHNVARGKTGGGGWGGGGRNVKWILRIRLNPPLPRSPSPPSPRMISQLRGKSRWCGCRGIFARVQVDRFSGRVRCLGEFDNKSCLLWRSPGVDYISRKQAGAWMRLLVLLLVDNNTLLTIVDGGIFVECAEIQGRPGTACKQRNYKRNHYCRLLFDVNPPAPDAEHANWFGVSFFPVFFFFFSFFLFFFFFFFFFFFWSKIRIDSLAGGTGEGTGNANVCHIPIYGSLNGTRARRRDIQIKLFEFKMPVIWELIK